MKSADTLAYVRASAAVLGLPLDDARVPHVAAHLDRTASMARLLDDLHLPPELEKAQIYLPKPHEPPVSSM